MFTYTRLSAIVAGLLATQGALARTDLSGCVSTEVIFETYYASLIWYVPGTGEICSFLDCGGGRAPPITTQPGCPLYKGTATITPSYLSGYPGAAAQAAPTDQGQASSEPAATLPGLPSESWDSNSIPSTLEVAPSSLSRPPAGSITAMPTTTSPPSSTASSSSSTTASTSASKVSSAAAAGVTGPVREVLGLVAGVVAGVALL